MNDKMNDKNYVCPVHIYYFFLCIYVNKKICIYFINTYLAI